MSNDTPKVHMNKKNKKDVFLKLSKVRIENFVRKKEK